MKVSKTTIRFWLRTDRSNSNGTCPIHLIYQISGQRKYFSVPNLLILPANWNANNQEAIFIKKNTANKEEIDISLLKAASEINEINDQLKELTIKVTSIENEFQRRNISFTAQMVIDSLKSSYSLKTKKELAKDGFFDFIDSFIEDHKSTREEGSLKIYRTLKRHLSDFRIATQVKVSFETIDYAFFQAFQNYLILKKGLNNTTVAKHLSTIKAILNYGRKQGIEVNDRYKDFKIKKEALEVIALTNDEFESLFALDLSHSKRLAQVRDVFCFGCATGLRFSDLDQLKWEHVKEDELRITVKKTKELLTIPLNPFSVAILEKYKGNLKPLPMISNQKLNQYLKGWSEKDAGGILVQHKGLCEMAGINEPIEIVRFRGTKREATVYPKYKLVGVHTARKTFATLSLEKGMSAEEVMTITGHKDYRSFSRYVKITEQRKKVVMKKAWGEIRPINLKAV